MNLQISGHHLEITPALHDYVTGKLERVTRHFDHVIDVSVILSVEKLKQKGPFDKIFSNFKKSRERIV